MDRIFKELSPWVRQGVGSAHSTLKDRERRLHGEGADGSTQLAKEPMLDTRVREHEQTSLQGIAKKARQDGKYRFCDVYRLITEELLLVACKGVSLAPC